MSSENSHREVAPQSDDTNRAFSASPSPIQQNNMEGSYATQVGGDPKQAAASALLQFRTRVNPDLPQEDPNTYTQWENRNTHDINGLSSSENRNTYSRSWTIPYTTNGPDNMSVQHNPYYSYSQATMQNTITGLTSAINDLQEEHLTMNTRQDNITGTLEQVLSALQELKSASASSSQMQSSMGSLQPQLATVIIPMLTHKETPIEQVRMYLRHNNGKLMTPKAMVILVGMLHPHKSITYLKTGKVIQVQTMEKLR